MKSSLTQERLMQVLFYDPEDGDFYLVRNGKIAGSLFRSPKSKTFYLRTKIDGRSYLLHRLAFLYVLGHWPSGQVDHKNGDGTDNKWSNLRESSESQNKANRKKQSNNTTGHKGITWHKTGKRFYARIDKDGKAIYLGCFKAAIAAYAKASVELFGEFSRVA